jgi:membrane protein DedA with SNARE-associated domain/rhodanese-related sulfurtransferase
VISFRGLLLRHGYTFLFSYVFAVQAGLPIPADPLLLIMGALVGDGQYSLWLSFTTATIGALAGDYFWYELGRMRGRSILRLLCKMSLEPDTCVRKTESQLSTRGLWTLLFAKFVPGVSLVSMPLAGAIRMPRARFLITDLAGCMLWCGSYLVAGQIFHRQITWLIERIGLLGRQAGEIALILLAIFAGWKYFQRWRLRRELRINRITPQEAFDLLSNGEPVTLVDLRNPAEIEQEGFKIAGARVLRAADLRDRSHEIPDDHAVILYCSCPNEVTSARVALELKRAGIRKVHPLEGGFDAWRAQDLPIEPYPEASPIHAPDKTTWPAGANACPLENSYRASD